MRWVRFEHEGTARWGQLADGVVHMVAASWAEILAGAAAEPVGTLDLNAVRLLAPVERPGKVVAVGLNYMDHCRETNTEPPRRPLLFAKYPTAIVGPGAAIRWSQKLTQEVDYEAELAVIIGRRARHVAEQDALSYVFGYTAGNDVSARDLQFSDGQWVRAKSLDTFCPLGPALVTADEVLDPQALHITCELNGETVQDSTTGEMIFGVAELVAFCSEAFTLEPGDVILTGTPHGTGAFRDPKLFMQHGDRVAVEIERIGRLENPCVVEDRP